jgi:uncharacterized protein (TIGR03435 family)
VRIVTFTGLLVGMACGALGQEFEVASIRVYTAPAGGPPAARAQGGPDSADPSRVRYVNQSLKDLLMSAYGVKRYQISGPPWLDGQKFEIVAKVPESATGDQVKIMLRNLLAERFKVATHRETRELPVFELTVGKSGPKMKAASDKPADTPDSLPTGAPGAPLMAGRVKMGPDGCPDFPDLRLGSRFFFMNGRGCLTAVQETMAGLAGMLSGRFDRPVLDKTGLSGKYDFILHFDPSGVVGTMPPEGGDNPLPDVFAAVQQQLGLRLEARKAPIDLLVIDYAEKLPSGN